MYWTLTSDHIMKEKDSVCEFFMYSIYHNNNNNNLPASLPVKPHQAGK